MEMKLLTYEEMSAVVGVPVATLQSWVHRRTVPFVRLGKRTVRFDAAVIERWLRSRAAGPSVVVVG